MEEKKPLDILEGEGIQRTDMHCHNCSKGFIAELDFDIDGTHIIICPHCEHEHCRRIEAGKITGDRWDSRNWGDQKVTNVKVWKNRNLVLKEQMSTASVFIRDKWLNFGT